MEKENVYKKQFKLSVIGILREFPNVIVMIVSAIISSSLIVWLDVIEGLVNFANVGFVAAVSKKLTKNLKYEYNYGTEKIEALSSLLCCMFEIFSLFTVIILSAVNIVEPEEPSKLLLVPILFKILKLVSDTTFLVKERNINRLANTKLTQSEYMATVKTFLFDAVTFVSIFICWLFRDYRAVWYFSPIICILTGVYLIFHSVEHIKKAISEVTEKTLPENEQMLILKCLSKYYDKYTELISVNSHIRGNVSFIELHLKFDASMTYNQIEEFKANIEKDLTEEISDCKITFII